MSRGSADQRQGSVGVEATLRGDGCALTLRATRYEYPDLSTGDDANWVSGEVELVSLRSGRFIGRMAVSIRTEELASFVAQLRILDSELTGEATLDHLEDEFGATMKLTKGGGTLEAFLRAHVQAELRVEEVRTDQSHVRLALTEFEVMSGTFPVRGAPSESR